MWQKRNKAITDDYTQYLLILFACLVFACFCVDNYASFMSTTTDMKTPSDEGKEKASERVLLLRKPRSIINVSALKHHKSSKEKLEYRKEIDDK